MHTHGFTEVVAGESLANFALNLVCLECQLPYTPPNSSLVCLPEALTKVPTMSYKRFNLSTFPELHLCLFPARLSFPCSAVASFLD